MENPEAKRSQYPYYGLEKCVEVAAVVRDLGGGRSEVTKTVLAHQMNVSDSSAAFQQLIGAVKSFGLIKGRGSYMLTEISKAFFYPTQEGQAPRALLQAIKAPQVFEEMINRFDGNRIPPSELLANILHREYGISTSWAPRVASLFASALRFAGALDGDLLQYESAMQRSLGDVPNDAEPTEPVSSTVPLRDATGRRAAVAPTVQPGPARSESRQEAAGMTVWVFKLRGQSVRLETSDDLTLDLWLKLNQYVQVLKPMPEAGAVADLPPTAS